MQLPRFGNIFPGMILLPTPRRVEMMAGKFVLPRLGFIQMLDSPEELLPAARAMQRAFKEIAGREYPLVVGGPDDDVVIDLLLSTQLPHQQGYEIEIEEKGIHITAAAPEGAFYAAQTLLQILRQYPDGNLPCVQIEDRPDFRARGVMLDISRDKVPTMATLFSLVDLLAELKINQLQLYTEHTFAYRNHPAVWAKASPMTGDEILQLDQYCRERFIELVPNQNSFGHMERWLKLPQYRDLAEAPDGFTFPWGVKHAGGFTLDPLDAGSIELVAGLYDELLPHFSSPLFNVGCDETFDLGLGKSQAECDRIGKGRVYLNFLNRIHALLQDHQKMMMFWGDIILHHPELIDELPRDVVAMEWGYEAGHPFDEHLAKFDEAGIPFFVCPGTSSWCSVAGRTDNALANLKEAAAAGIKHSAAGYLITDWGDYGHHQPLPVSYLGFAAGAAYSWSFEANNSLNIIDAMDVHVFRDRNKRMGRVAFELGNVYQACKAKLANGSPLFWTLFGGPDHKVRFSSVTADEFASAQAAMKRAIEPISGSAMGRPDGALIIEEFRFAAHLLTHSCARGQFLLDHGSHAPFMLAQDAKALIVEHERIWTARNRLGGLADSVSRIERMESDYR